MPSPAVRHAAGGSKLRPEDSSEKFLAHGQSCLFTRARLAYQLCQKKS